MPYFVAYVSSAKKLLSAEELTTLLETCRRHNEALGITGALLYQDGNFMQVLEGEQGVVEELYDAIAADPRHRNVISLVRGTTPEPQFANWSMAFADRSGRDSVLAAQYRDFLAEESQGTGDAGIGRRLLRSFRRTLDARPL